MAEQRELNLILRLKDEATKSLKGFEGQLKGLEPSLKKISLVGAGVFTAVSGVVIKASMDINKMNSEIVKGTGASGKMLEDFLESATKVGKLVPQSFGETARALAEINTRLELTEGELENATKSFLDFSRVTGVEVVSSIKNVSRMMGDWGVSVLETEKTLDKLVSASQISGVSVEQLTNDIVTYGVQLRTLGYSQDEAIAMLSKFEKEGVATSKVFSGLSIAMANLSELGVSDIPKAFKETVKAIGDAKTESEAVTIAMGMFGRRAGPDLAIAVREGRFELDSYLSVIMESEDALKNTAEASLTFAEELSILKDNLFATFQPIAKSFIPILRDLTERIKVVAEKAQEWISNNEELFKKIVVITLAVSGFLAVLFPVVKIVLAVISVFKSLVAVLAVLKGALFVVGAVIAGISAPVWIAIGVITALIAIGVLLYKNWETISQKAQEIFGVIADFISEKFNAIKDTISNVLNTVSNIVSGTWEVIKQIFTFALALIAGLVIMYFNAMGIDILAVLQSIQMTIQFAWEFIKMIFETAMLMLSEWWGIFWEGLSTKMGATWNFIKEVIGGAWNWITEIFKKAVAPINEVWTNLWDGMKNVMDASWEVIKSAVKASINYIIDQINKVIEAVNRVAQTGAGALGLDIPNIPTIPRLAKGGIVTKPTIAMIGEAGPEAVVPLKGNNAMGGMTINVNVNGDVTGREVVEFVKQSLMRDLRMDTKFSL